MTELVRTQTQCEATCSVCRRPFVPRFSYQQQERGGESVAFCSSRCQLAALSSPAEQTCACCGARFVPSFAYQWAVQDGRSACFCSLECRAKGATTRPRLGRLAVFNCKGGTGKTTTAVSVAAGLATRGYRVLLIDADPQGSVEVSLGLRAKRGLYQLLVLGASPGECAVAAGPGLDVIVADRSLAAAELFLAGRTDRERVMRDRLQGLSGYDVTVIDCSPSVGIMNRNALMSADGVLLPVACDFLSIAGLQQAIRTLGELKERGGHELQVVGVLPTQYDKRLRVCREALDWLGQRFGDLVLEPVRLNTRIREAPAHRQTIYDYAPDSTGAADYSALVARLAGLLGVPAMPSA